MLSPQYVEAGYYKYFAPEIKPFFTEQFVKKYAEICQNYINEINEKLPEDFYEKRKIGENGFYLLNLIRNDMVKEFDDLVKQKGVQNLIYQCSFYETNSFFLKSHIQCGRDIISYAFYFGSIKIIKYLINLSKDNYIRNISDGIEPWVYLYAVHCQNTEIFDLIQSEYKPDEKLYKRCFKNAIKFHNKDMANYINTNFLENKATDLPETFIKSLKYYNFSFMKDSNFNGYFFFNLCQYDYYLPVSELLLKNDININVKTKTEYHRYEGNKKTPFFAAVENGNTEIIQLLLSNSKLDVNIFNGIIRPKRTYCEMTAFSAAVENEYIDIVKLILANNKLNVNKVNKDNDSDFTALHAAVLKRNTEIVSLLVNNETLNPNINLKRRH